MKEDRAISQKVKAIAQAVAKGMIGKRREAGLNDLVSNPVLADATKPLSASILVDIESPDLHQLTPDVEQEVFSNGYLGTEVGLTFLRQNWPVETPSHLIASEFVDTFASTLTDDLWEDWAFGLNVGMDERYPGRLGLCIVLATGWYDGNALVVNHINEERTRRGLGRLNLNSALRSLARHYLNMETHLIARTSDPPSGRLGMLIRVESYGSTTAECTPQSRSQET